MTDRLHNATKTMCSRAFLVGNLFSVCTGKFGTEDQTALGPGFEKVNVRFVPNMKISTPMPMNTLKDMKSLVIPTSDLKACVEGVCLDCICEL